MEAPLLQEYEVKPGVAFKLALAPWQTANVPVIVGDGLGLMVTTCDEEPEQPPANVTVTVYVPGVFGEIEADVAPLFHKYDNAPAGAALSVADEPWHAANVPEITGIGLAFIVTDCDVEPVQPFALVTVTVYVPATLGVIDDVVAPLLHEYEVMPDGAFNVADAPWQTANVPVIAGNGFGLIVTVCDAVPVQPPTPVTVTV